MLPEVEKVVDPRKISTELSYMGTKGPRALSVSVQACIAHQASCDPLSPNDQMIATMRWLCKTLPLSEPLEFSVINSNERSRKDKRLAEQ